MKEKKILVTGAGGYIGRHVVSALLNYPNVHVVAADFSDKGIDPRAEFCSGDIFSGSPHIFEEMGSPDVCLHLAWKDGFNHKSDYHMKALSSHFAFLKGMMDGGLKQLSVMGTMHEVGYHEGAIREDTPCNPLSFYGIAKNALRQAAFLYAKDRPVVLQWLRAYYIYGDDLKNHSVFTKLVEAEQAGRMDFPFVSGKNKYDFITVEGLARQIAACVMQDKISGVIECCTGEGVPIGEKMEQFIQHNHFHIRLNYGAYPDRPYDSPGVWGDVTKIRQVLENKQIKT